ncbi:oocyte zinc finger protein XlCOF7.1-like [Pseudophryne corroboree]|uniref:oocyte zinc finger protein XlCOF7.1-like n=1 Tax=Pseudophryne corroboree TaxID=495146 RepID=UPI0030820F1D
MDKDRRHLSERILSLTLEIIHLLTGEDYTVGKKTSSECMIPSCFNHVSGGLSRTQSPITFPPPHSLIHDTDNDQKILDITNKIIQLLTGEVSIRCQDVTVYFSMDEWEYIEEHRGLYKDVMMENHQPLTSLDGPSNRDTPERCPRPLYSQDCTVENHRIPQEHQVEHLTEMKVEPMEGEEDMYISADQQCRKEDITTDNSTVDGRKSKNPLEPYHIWRQDFKIEDDITCDSPGENIITLNVHPSNHSECFPDNSDTFTHITAVTGNFACSECGKCYRRKTTFLRHQRTHTGEKPFPCSECGKCFTQKSDLAAHQISHNVNKPFPCSECGKHFPSKSNLSRHQRSHTGEKPFPCSECGKYFTQKSDLHRHQVIHTGLKPFLCSECGKCFPCKSNFIRHQRSHTGEKPFPCYQCGKCFAQKSHLVSHQRLHIGVKHFTRKPDLGRKRTCDVKKPFLCTECGKCFPCKSNLIRHQRSHTGEKPFPCSECGGCFTQKSDLSRHQVIHSGLKPFPCSECGKCFRQVSSLIKHQRRHTGEKPFLCSQCGKCFVEKAALVAHQIIHMGVEQFP